MFTHCRDDSNELIRTSHTNVGIFAREIEGIRFFNHRFGEIICEHLQKKRTKRKYISTWMSANSMNEEGKIRNTEKTLNSSWRSHLTVRSWELLLTAR